MSTMKGKTMPNQNNKLARIKALSPIIIAFISLIGTLCIAYIQSSSASKTDLKATLTKLDQAIKQINEFVIPQIQRNFQTLDHDYSILNIKTSDSRERIARIEGILETLPRHLKARFTKKNPGNPENPGNPGHKKITKVPVIDIQ